MKSNTQGEVDKCYSNGDLEFVYQDANQTSLEYVRVEKQQEDNYDGKYYADILDTETKMSLKLNQDLIQIITEQNIYNNDIS